MTRRTGLLVPVGRAEPLVAVCRRRWDPVAARGVPAHITVLYPFVPAERLGPAEITAARDVLAEIPAFDFALTRAGRFEDAVLYLAPEPEDPFRRITAALTARFPEHPPYEGKFEAVIPHLTVADAPDAPLAELEAELTAGLPLADRATDVILMEEGHDDQWHTRATFPLHS